MRPPLTLLTAALLSICVSACGHTNGGTGSTSHSPSTAATTSSTQVYTKADSDKDNDIGAPNDDPNNNTTLDYGHAASPADKQAVTGLIKRYYTAAEAGNGTYACSMIVSSLAKATAEDYGHGSGGPTYLSSGKTCPTVMALLFKHFHSQLTAELPKLNVARVRLNGDRGIAILNFGTMPERQISVGLEGHTWKVLALLDSELS